MENLDNNGGSGTNSGQGQDDANLPKFSELDPNNLTPEQAADVIKSAQTLLGQRNHARERSVDPTSKKPYKELYEEAVKKTAPKAEAIAIAPQPQALDDETKADVAMLKVAEEKRQFGHANSLTPEETDNLFAWAAGMNLKPADALQQPFFKGALAAQRAENRQEGGTPRPSRRAPIVEGKHFNEMSNDEKRKNFGKVVEAAQKQ